MTVPVVRTKTKGNRAVISAWVPAPVAVALKEAAADAESTVSSQIRLALRAHLGDRWPK